MLQRRIARHPPDEIRFNLLAMVRDPRAHAAAVGDSEALAAEERKRAAWRWENALRRHNFVGFAGELAKAVVRAKLAEGDEAYQKWIDEAKARTKAKVDERRKKGQGGDGDDG